MYNLCLLGFSITEERQCETRDDAIIIDKGELLYTPLTVIDQHD